jgi:hypothetical protein
MLGLFHSKNLTPCKYKPLVKMMVATVLISFTLSLLFAFPTLSEIYALPSRGGGGNGFPNLSSHSTLHPSDAFPLSGAHTNGPGSLPGLSGGTNMINGPNGPHPNAPTVLNGPNGPRVINPNNPTVLNGPNGPRVINPNNPTTTTTAVVRPSNCPTVVHPNGADTTVAHPSNCPSSDTKVSVRTGGSSTSSSSSLTVNNVQQQGSSSASTPKELSQSALPCLAKNTIITVNVYGGMTRNLPFKAGQTSNTVQGITVTLRC